LEYFIKISFLGIGIYFIISFTELFLRSIRLKQIFRSFDEDINFFMILATYGVGALLNEISPGKTGDLTRMETIYLRNKEFSVHKGLSGISIEYLLDLITFLLVFSSSLLILSINNIRGTFIKDIQDLLFLGFLLSLCLTIFITILFLKPKWILNLSKKISTTLHKKLKRFFVSFLAKVENFKSSKKEATISSILSFPIWILESLKFILIFNLTDYQINIFLIILAQIIASLPKLLPLTPGGWGISEISGSLFLIGFISVSYESLLSVFIVEHMIGLMFIIIFGVISQISLNFIDIGHLDRSKQSKK
jgi:uncharacterized protein (TIRG00374 family)